MHALVRIVFGVLLIVLACSDARAVSRGIRVDFAGDWGEAYVIGSADCPGSSAFDTFVQFAGFTFSGYDDPAYNFDTDTYCQRTVPFNPSAPSDPYFSGTSFFSGDETALAALVGQNRDNAASGIRYTYLSGPRFSDPNGFQWAFYFFPRGVTLVGLYGLTAIPLTDEASYIQAPDTSFVWRGGSDGYTTEYFCFRNVGGVTSYLGFWTGLQDGSACSQALSTLFGDGFEN